MNDISDYLVEINKRLEKIRNIAVYYPPNLYPENISSKGWVAPGTEDLIDFTVLIWEFIEKLPSWEILAQIDGNIKYLTKIRKILDPSISTIPSWKDIEQLYPKHTYLTDWLASNNVENTITFKQTYEEFLLAIDALNLQLGIIKRPYIKYISTDKMELRKLCQKLKDKGFIDSSITCIDFQNSFILDDITKKINWTGKNGAFSYFITKIIVKDKHFKIEGPGAWVCASNMFLIKGKTFTSKEMQGFRSRSKEDEKIITQIMNEIF